MKLNESNFKTWRMNCWKDFVAINILWSISLFNKNIPKTGPTNPIYIEQNAEKTPNKKIQVDEFVLIDLGNHQVKKINSIDKKLLTP